MTEVVKERQLPTGEGLTFEKVWAMFQETREQIRDIAEQQKETARLFRETDKKIKQTNEQYGDLSHRFGEVVEHLVAPGIEEKFNEMGYHFSEVYDGDNRIKNEKGEKIAEIDILMENGETILAVEVKSKPNNKDVNEHIKRVKTLRETRSKKKDNRKIIGAIAGAIFKNNVKEAAQKAGFYVIVQTGDTMRIDMPEGWKPAVF
jgi:hypothetical protein